MKKESSKAYNLGKEFFGKYASGREDLSIRYIKDKIIKDKIDSKRGKRMQILLNFDSLDIKDKRVLSFLKNRSSEEIKKLFLKFLKKELLKDENDLDAKLRNLKVVNVEKSKKIAKSLDRINEELKNSKDVDLNFEKEKYLKEKYL